MKPLIKSGLATLFLIALFACQKEMSEEVGNEPDPPPPPVNKPSCQLTRWVQGLHNGGADDTVFTFKYDAQGRLTQIYDSVYNETFFLTYSSGRLTRLDMIENAFPTDTFPLSKYTYLPNGLLKENESYFPYRLRYVFEYNPGDTLPASSTLYYTSFSGFIDTTITRYTWQNGNLLMQEELSNGTYTKTAEFTYANLPNNFRLLALADLGRRLTFRFWDIDYFNKSMMKSSKWYQYSAMYESFYDHTTDSMGNVTSAIRRFVDQFTGIPYAESRFFQFTCK